MQLVYNDLGRSGHEEGGDRVRYTTTSHDNIATGGGMSCDCGRVKDDKVFGLSSYAASCVRLYALMLIGYNERQGLRIFKTMPALP